MDPYKVLGVSYNASDDEIKKAYRGLSRKYHPDANVGNPNQKEYEEKFKEVQQAYNMIMDQRQGKVSLSRASETISGALADRALEDRAQAVSRAKQKTNSICALQPITFRTGTIARALMYWNRYRTGGGAGIIIVHWLTTGLGTMR